jgi:hypothetical protein
VSEMVWTTNMGYFNEENRFKRDASLEEVLHIISHALWASAYPTVFGETNADSELVIAVKELYADCEIAADCDLARMLTGPAMPSAARGWLTRWQARSLHKRSRRQRALQQEAQHVNARPRSIPPSMQKQGPHRPLVRPPPLASRRLSRACGCGAGQFCNFDYGSTGGCEACSAYSAASACANDGLPAKGAADCRAQCFEGGGGDEGGGTPASTGATLCTHYDSSGFIAGSCSGKYHYDDPTCDAGTGSLSPPSLCPPSLFPPSLCPPSLCLPFLSPPIYFCLQSYPLLIPHHRNTFPALLHPSTSQRLPEY